VDFNDVGDIVLELLLAHDHDSALEVVLYHINVKTGESATVRKEFLGPALEFIGVKDGRYLYLDGRNLDLQSSEAPDPIPLASVASKPPE
jgi:hypothetical protein